MTDTIEDLVAKLEPFQPLVGRKLQHVKTSGFYRITGLCFREADMHIMFTYETLHQETVNFARPIEELVDGRFKIFPKEEQLT